LENSSAKRVSAEKLKAFCIDALQSAGLSYDDAETAAQVLVTTDTWGTFTHGTHHLRNYITKIRAGGIDPKAKPQIVREGPGWAIIDGHAAIGMVTGCRAMELAIQKAATDGIGYVGVRNSTHFGGAGYYATLALPHDMMGIAMSNVDPIMVAPGGRVSVIGNNPFAYATPAGEEYPIFLDIALSAVASTKIHTAKALGKSIPADWIVDAEGLPATEIGDWPSVGSMLPMAGHKGYGLAILVEVLAGVLTGAAVTQEVKGWMAQVSEPPGTGHSFIAIDVGRIMPIGAFKQRMDSMIQGIKASPKAKGADRIWLPGEMEWERRKVALREGIPLPEVVLESLAKLSQEIGRDLQDIFP
jgi:ureidoglycolate dehydrogenase (NAD+)